MLGAALAARAAGIVQGSPMSAGAAGRAVLRSLDHTGRAHHCFLEASDRCHYLWDYVPGAARAQTHRWIWELKGRRWIPAAAAAATRHQRRAIEAAALALRAALPQAWVEQTSWSPIPSSQDSGDAQYDDRLLRLLRMAFGGYDADIRPLIRQIGSSLPDHRGPHRLPFAELHALMRVDEMRVAERPLRPEVVLFDDVLTTGKHFKCAQARLREALGPVCISACFLARRVLSPRRRGLTGATP